MVDFNQETFISKSVGDIQRITILERRNNVIEAMEVYRQKQIKGIDPPDHFVKSRIRSLFDELQGWLKRDYKNYDKLKEDVFSEEFDTVYKVFYAINEWLDEKRLTRVDTRRSYDSRNVETENKEKKL